MNARLAVTPLLIALMFGDHTAPTPPPAPEASFRACSGFSEEQLHKSPLLAWRFRSCSDGVRADEVQVQFRNRSDQPLAFEFRLWLQAIPNCRSTEPPSLQGTRILAAHSAEEWPYTTHELNSAAEFKGRIWLCVREVGR